MSAEIINPPSGNNGNEWFDEGPHNRPLFDEPTPELTVVATEADPTEAVGTETSEGKPVIPMTNEFLAEINESLKNYTPTVEEYDTLLDNYHERFRVELDGTGHDVANGKTLDGEAVDTFNNLIEPARYLLGDEAVAQRQELAAYDPLTTNIDKYLASIHDFERIAHMAVDIKRENPTIDWELESIDVMIANRLADTAQRELALNDALRDWGYDESNVGLVDPDTTQAVEPASEPENASQATQTPVAQSEAAAVNQVPPQRVAIATSRLGKDPLDPRQITITLPTIPKMPANQSSQPEADQPVFGSEDPLQEPALPGRSRWGQTVGSYEEVRNNPVRAHAANVDGTVVGGLAPVAGEKPSAQPEQQAVEAEKLSMRQKLGRMATKLQARVNTAIVNLVSHPGEEARSFAEADRHQRIGMVARGVGYVSLAIGSYVSVSKGIDMWSHAGTAASVAAEAANHMPSGNALTNITSVAPPVPKVNAHEMVMQAPQGGRADSVWGHMYKDAGVTNERQAVALFREIQSVNPGKDLSNIHVGEHVVMPRDDLMRRILEENK